MHRVQGEGRTSAQDGEARLRHRRRIGAGRSQAGQSPGGQETVHPALHPVVGACVPVPRRQLPAAVVPEDEARRPAHEELQAEDQRRLPHLQAAHRPLLLPRQALSGAEVSSALLSQHQAQAQAAAAPTEVSIYICNLVARSMAAFPDVSPEC